MAEPGTARAGAGGGGSCAGQGRPTRRTVAEPGTARAGAGGWSGRGRPAPPPPLPVGRLFGPLVVGFLDRVRS
ncbi:hypothetical protein [Streptomyces aurantiogriseus]|uniref:hypothetical protein n=1 Tax=Streptomyces aurantiogriseus TaxID=66870 RepID=UPI00167B10C0|nr:hypothetical protein [Streptomyces aurantiogriseus]